jgi:hypothetical protein
MVRQNRFFIMGLFTRKCLLVVFSSYVLGQTVIQTAKNYNFFFKGGVSRYLNDSNVKTGLDQFGYEAYQKVGTSQEVLAVSSATDMYLSFRIQYAMAPLVLNYDLSNFSRSNYILLVSSTARPLKADADACGEKFECQLVHERDTGYQNLTLRLFRILKELS